MIDLHSHSSASDGARSPADSARYAIEKKLRVWALTDHDSVEGLCEAASVCASEDTEMIFVPGIEINIAWQSGEFHLLGLGLKKCSDELRSTIEYLTEGRLVRNQQIIDMAKKDIGIELNIDDMMAKFGTKQLGRPHFARMLAELGIVKKPQDAFDRFLGSGRPWYVKHAGEDLDVAIEAIKTSGGIPVMAHPKSIYVSLNKIEPILEDVRNRGVMGIEAYHPCVRINEGARLEEIARKLGMFVTAGSDFHGKGIRADRHLGFTAGDLKIADRFWDEELLPALGGEFDYRETEFFKGDL
ncbi:MAG: PHP domain-containing protein [Treponema sp.]|nr:PHP domain-containing protein [Treponema sp.]